MDCLGSLPKHHVYLFVIQVQLDVPGLRASGPAGPGVHFVFLI